MSFVSTMTGLVGSKERSNLYETHFKREIYEFYFFFYTRILQNDCGLHSEQHWLTRQGMMAR